MKRRNFLKLSGIMQCSWCEEEITDVGPYSGSPRYGTEVGGGIMPFCSADCQDKKHAEWQSKLSQSDMDLVQLRSAESRDVFATFSFTQEQPEPVDIDGSDAGRI